MLWCLITIWFYLLCFLYFSTVFLILCRLSWGRLPHLYLQCIERLQKELETMYPLGYFDRMPWSNLIDASDRHSLLHRTEHRDFEIVKEDLSPDLMDVQLQLARAGVEAIVQDQLTSVFTLAPAYQRNRLNWNLWRRLRPRPGLRVLWIASTFVRFLFILPVRVALFLTSFLFVIVCCLVAGVVNFSDSSKTAIGVIYCRLYTAGSGLVCTYKDTHNRPKRPGIAVSNHLSPNDLMVICADVPHDREYLYTVTGQSHNGIIYAIEHLCERLCDALWLERTSAESRHNFMLQVLERGKNAGPVIVFPEGYCTNNTQVLQFRRAVFDKDITIYPIAIKQNARYGDSYWFEDTISTYYLRQLASWASVYEVTYLPAQRMKAGETSEQFAGARAAVDRGHDRHPADRDKYKGIIQKNIAEDLITSCPPSPTLTNSSVEFAYQ
ncbi:PlsC domain-containing protein [Aphelenchoides fujianensis]|nr:PlsC domain-containing protein [Aphelenchoides fujianensis]